MPPPCPFKSRPFFVLTASKKRLFIFSREEQPEIISGKPYDTVLMVNRDMVYAAAVFLKAMPVTGPTPTYFLPR